MTAAWDESGPARRRAARQALEVVDRVRELLAQERQARGLTWEELGLQLGYHLQTVHGQVNGGKGFSEDSLRRALAWLATPPPATPEEAS